VSVVITEQHAAIRRMRKHRPPRELKALVKIEKEDSAHKMQRLLRNACHATNLACEQGVPLKPGLIVLIERRYDSCGPPAPAASLRVFVRENRTMTEQEEQDLHRKVDRLETEVHLLGRGGCLSWDSSAGGMLNRQSFMG
jgi:hypothetical protein